MVAERRNGTDVVDVDIETTNRMTNGTLFVDAWVSLGSVPPECGSCPIE